MRERTVTKDNVGNDGTCTHLQEEQVQAGITWGSVGDLGKAWGMEWPIDVSEGLWGVGRRQSSSSSEEEEEELYAVLPG